ncbi:MAG: hypothetical protein ACPGLV_08070 [Bacteroidia bacterium]
MSTEEYNEKEEFEPQDSYESDYEEEEEEQPRKGSRIILVIAVLALVGLNIFLGINIYSQTEKLKEKEAEIAELAEQKKELIARVDSLKSVVTNLNDEIVGKDSSMTALQDKILELESALKGAQGQISDLKTYKQRYQDYLKYKNQVTEKEAEIDKLKQEKQAALERAANAENANDTLTQLLNEVNDVNAKLENKINLGKRLTGTIKEIKSYRDKRGKLKETDKSTQVTDVVVKYTIAENAIADKETKTAYIVVKQGSKTLTQAGNAFEIEGGKKIDYTQKDDIKYNGKDITQSPRLKFAEELTPGKYNLEIYIDNKLFGSQDFTLR